MITSALLLVVVMVAIVILYALRHKGRVKADFRCMGTAFTLEVDEKHGSPAERFPASADVKRIA